MQTLFITGVGSGLGEALAKHFLQEGWRVYAVGRHCSATLKNHPEFFFYPFDLTKTYIIEEELGEILHNHRFELAILNAGMLGDIKPLMHTPLERLKEVMELNVWANKGVIDTLMRTTHTEQIVGISSGAAVNGSKGWGAYSVSKAALNMLLKVYAKEHPKTHFTALAPGVIDTPMVRHILEEVDEHTYPSVARLKRGEIQTPHSAAKRLYETFPKLLAYESGSFVDVRNNNINFV